jgi:hypothetical protein
LKQGRRRRKDTEMEIGKIILWMSLHTKSFKSVRNTYRTDIKKKGFIIYISYKFKTGFLENNYFLLYSVLSYDKRKPN